MQKITRILISILLIGVIPNTHAIEEQHAYTTEAMTLTLDEAILLAVRENPNVQSSKLGYVSQKFNLWVQEWQFQPHYSFQAAAVENRNTARHQHSDRSHNYSVEPGVSLLTPIGTQLSLTANGVDNKGFNPTLSAEITQPLLRGFGRAVVEASLNNARDTDVISRLQIEGTLRSTVTGVINAYLDVVSAEKTIQIDEDALKRSEKSVEQTRLYIKAGRKAGNELITVQANVATAKTQLENDKNNLLQARYAFLAALGIDPNSNIKLANLNVKALIDKYVLPSVDQTKRLVLMNDIQYQVDNITLHGPTTRSILVAEDNDRWQLNFSATATAGHGVGAAQDASVNSFFTGINNLFNGTSQSQSVGLTLNVPINDQVSKQAVLNAKIAMKQAELALKQEKWSKETGAINGWNNVMSAKRALVFAEDAEKLQEKTYNVSYQKYIHGLIDSLELQSAQLSLIQAQQALLHARIGYLKALVSMDQLIGHTLKTWDVKVRL